MINSRKYLVEAFSEGSRATRGYLVFAALAEKEGYPQIAALFRGTAQAETVYVHPHLQALGSIGASAERRREAYSGEGRELREISPVMLVAARDAGPKKPPERFVSANDQEKKHTTLYLKALARLSEQAKGNYYVCCECGSICEQKRPEKCPRCQSGVITFVKVG